jgi:hypothetical protein
LIAPQSASPRGAPTGGVEDLFDAAAAAAGIVEQRIVIGGLPIRLRFAGEAMRRRIGGSFSHLASAEPGDGELIVDVWDSASTGVGAAPRLGAPAEGDGTGPIYYYEHDGVRALSRWGTLSVLDGAAGHAWFWTADPAELLSWDWASPLRAIIHWWLGRHGILQVHGGAVGVPDGGVLVVGRGGSGKSTTTLACLSSGLRYAGDDFVGIQVEPEPWIHSLYSSGKLEPHHLERFPSLISAVANPVRREEEKAIVFAGEAAPGVPIAGFPLRAVLVPKVVAAEPRSRVVPTSPVAALAALAPSTIFQLYPPQTDALARMSALVRQVPCFSLELGSDVARIPETIHALLEGQAVNPAVEDVRR